MERDLTPALDELHDAFARAKAQVHVLRLAVTAIQDEGDIRALIACLTGIEDDLRAAETLLKH
ncbi:hypothetical protein [Aestuariivirga sp.]|uniref:hypothetical protein n=1 Tax=Aestuariivirga sp. TaxID=2650926 RepID=UPI00391C9677